VIAVPLAILIINSGDPALVIDVLELGSCANNLLQDFTAKREILYIFFFL